VKKWGQKSGKNALFAKSTLFPEFPHDGLPMLKITFRRFLIFRKF
jgi:hypothetical protein